MQRKTKSVTPPPGDEVRSHLVKTRAGWVAMASRGKALCRIVLPVNTREGALAALKRSGFSAEVVEPPQALRGVVKAVVGYFAGEPVDPARISAELDPGKITPFAKRVYDALRSIPRGSTATYAELAAAAGRPKASRAVGMFMARNPLPLLVPCHRVVASDGGLGGFSSSGGLPDKRRLLALEGIALGAKAKAR